MAGTEGEKGKWKDCLRATVRILVFVPSRWEPWRVLSRGGRGSDLGPHRIPLAACREWTVGVGTSGGREKSSDSGYLHFEGGAAEFADV